MVADRLDCRLVVFRRCVFGVMHNRAVVVVSKVEAILHMAEEIVLHAGHDVLEDDVDEQIAVRTTLLVPKSDRVPDLVNAVSGGAIRTERYELLITLSADGGRAATARARGHVVGF